MSYIREIPKSNIGNFKAWKEIMNLNLITIGDIDMKFLENQYVSPFDPLIVDQMVDKKNHNTMMIGIASSLNYFEFDEVKKCATTHEMWNKMKTIYGGDDNVRRAKEESLRGHFYQMKMGEDENITKYSERIKESVIIIRSLGEIIYDLIIDIKLCRSILGHTAILHVFSFCLASESVFC